MTEARRELLASLAEAGRRIERRGWALGTSGNFSAVVSDEPLRLAISASGLDKAKLDGGSFVEVDDASRVVAGNGRASAETLLHVAVVRARGARAVLHTHSVWSTLLTDAYEADGALEIEGFEMLKGLDGVATHEHRERIPIVPNAQEMGPLAERVSRLLDAEPRAHAFLLARHGLYTWGRSVEEALRHVEILEFLFEVLGRKEQGGSRWRS